jgi:hypothetical protein
MFEGIPDEIKRYNQWIVWRYEEMLGGKPTKVPYQPNSFGLASVTEPSTWSSFEHACQAFSNGGFNGIGFVLTENDPFTFIDLDNPFELDNHGNPKYETPQEILDRQVRIHEAFSSYSEKSPSGYGLHIIVKGSVPTGRRKQAVEVYSTARYMTMTGQVFNNAPIEPRQELISLLWSEMKSKSDSVTIYDGDEQERNSDFEILQKAADAQNGEKFKALYDGRWTEYYTSQSEADFAIINIIAFYTQNKTQIKRIFRASALGKRKKANREDYVAYMINKSFDRMTPLVDLVAIKEKMTEILEKKEWKEPEVKKIPINRINPYTFPPGLIGEIAQFIYDQSIYPVKEISLVAALAFMSGICGKSYNVSGTGLNNYFVLLAKTGRGKEAMAKGIDKIVSEVKKTTPNVVDFIGPAEFASPQGLVKHLQASPSFMSVLTEFAMMLKQLTAFNANANTTGLRRMFLNLYNKSGDGQTLGGIVYSDRDKNVQTLTAPAFSILGECTPEKYYRLLDEDLISEGLLPRFTTIEYLGERCSSNKNHYLVHPSRELIQSVSTVVSNSFMLINNKSVIHVKFDDEAAKIFSDYNENKCNGEINKSDTQGVSAELWTRSHVKAMKLAALVAIGINPFHPVITKDAALWAINIINFDNENIISKFENGEVSSNNIDFNQIKEATRIVEEFRIAEYDQIKKYKSVAQEMFNLKIVTYKYLNQRLAPLSCFRNDKIGATNALKKVIKSLIDSGEMQEIPIGQIEREFNTRQLCFSTIKNKFK